MDVCDLRAVGNSDISGIGVFVPQYFSDGQVRSASYAQAFLGLAIFLPSTREFVKAVFLSSFTAMLALNVAGLYFRNNIDMYHGFVITSLNMALTAPIMVSIIHLFHESLATITSYVMCFLVSQILVTVSLTYNTPFSLAWLNRLNDHCKSFRLIGTLIMIIAPIHVFLFLVYPVCLITRIKQGSSNSAQETESGLIRTPSINAIAKYWVSGFYLIAIVSVILIELLRKSVGLINDTEDLFTFGQIFAVATLVSPLFEVFKALLRISHEATRKNASLEWVKNVLYFCMWFFSFTCS